nr:MAG TPA: NS3 helicase, NS3, BVDV, flavivirus, pestivirus.82A [Caudoviricetes sp.]
MGSKKMPRPMLQHRAGRVGRISPQKSCPCLL